MERLPIIYVRGYAGSTAGIDGQVDDPFYGFNLGATHVRVGGDGDPMFYQFEGPLLRLMTDENYRLLVRGDQQQYLEDEPDGTIPHPSLWVYRFYDQAATTFLPTPHHEGMIERLWTKLHQQVTADGFDIEVAAAGLYELIQLVRLKTGAERVHVVAHSMGGLVVRCMMQKVCLEAGRDPAHALIDKFFTYGTPHGGISFNLGALDWAEQAFGPNGADIFAPEKMYGYLTAGKEFGDTPGAGDNWDPQRLPDGVFEPGNVFCLIGTDPKDYGPSRIVVGPKSDGLVRIEHAYVRGAHRAYVFKSHSGSYGEVNSEEGYQNLRRFLFGRWGVSVDFDGLAGLPGGSAGAEAVWQADVSLAIRGVSVVISEQQAAHWCPIQLNDELARHKGIPDIPDTPDTPVPLVTTFLLDPAHEAELVQERGEAARAPRHGGRLRYVLSLRVYQLSERGGTFRFAEHLEQVPDWTDALIVDVGPNADGSGLAAWAAWNSTVEGAKSAFDPITDGLRGGGGPIPFERNGAVHSGAVDMPSAARALPILGGNARLSIKVTDRLAATAVAEP